MSHNTDLTLQEQHDIKIALISEPKQEKCLVKKLKLCLPAILHFWLFSPDLSAVRDCVSRRGASSKVTRTQAEDLWPHCSDDTGYVLARGASSRPYAEEGKNVSSCTQHKKSASICSPEARPLRLTGRRGTSYCTKHEMSIFSVCMTQVSAQSFQTHHTAYKNAGLAVMGTQMRVE